ncbi:MAG: outer membrane beta-barrel protein [Gemmatimonadetes bacterium]|nr:outer membrane beta-barrel protein [Gemmatimonadota bacterium]
MLRSITLPAAALLLVAGAGVVGAQSPFGVEVRGGAAFPTSDLGASSLKTGGGLEFTASYRVQPHVHAYVGWDWHRLATRDAFQGDHFDVEDTGYAVGLQFRHPLAGAVAGWARAGGIYNHIELENRAGSIVDDSGHELGWEAGGGLHVPIGTHLALTPGVRYRTFSATIDAGGGPVPVDLRYVAAEIGLSWSFGEAAATAANKR